MSGAWWSQPFAEEGSATAEGIINQLGRPELDELTVLVREAAQNSWDARSGDEPVDFVVRIDRLGERSPHWLSRLTPAPAGGAVAQLREHLAPHSIIITISDRNTRGLGGPTRAGSRAPDGQRSDFVQFLRNVGEARDNELGGGTYGFGKGIFYRLSAASTIMVDSYIGDGSLSERRLMGAALGASFYNDEGRRFTGRHWWGDTREGIPDPLLGEDAIAVAADLGLPGFEDGRTGTDIVVVGAQLDDDLNEPGALRSAGTFIASSILWNLWPKLVHGPTGHLPMRFSVEVEGRSIVVPDPRDVEHLRPFVESLEMVRGNRGATHVRRSAPFEVGQLHTSLAQAEAPFSEVVDVAKPFSGPPHHVARMRRAELVVDYFQGPEHADPLFCYGGVFQSSAESDEHFAAAEPPTHDDWVESGLRGTTKGVVQNARVFIRRRLDEDFGSANRTQGQGAAGLGVLATRLARLTPGLSGGRAASRDRTSSSNPGRRQAGTSYRSARVLEGPTLQVFRDQAFVVARVLVPGSESTRIWTAEVAVVVDGGGKESTGFAGALSPAVIEWRPVAGGPSVAGHSVQIGAGGDSEWWVYAVHVPDAAIRMTIRKAANV